MTTDTQPKTPARNRLDVETARRRHRRAYTLIKELAAQAGYLDLGPYLSGLDILLEDLEAGAFILILEKQPQE